MNRSIYVAQLVVDLNVRKPQRAYADYDVWRISVIGTLQRQNRIHHTIKFSHTFDFEGVRIRLIRANLNVRARSLPILGIFRTTSTNRPEGRRFTRHIV